VQSELWWFIYNTFFLVTLLLQDMGISPDLKTYTYLLGAFKAGGQWDRVQRILDKINAMEGKIDDPFQ
jgi:hypothetical protein